MRHLDWDGCFNARDLGGLRTSDGRVVQRGRVVRADSLEQLTAAGWQALVAHGVRTVVDLRNDDEIGADAAPRPASVTTVRVPLDNAADREFWDVWQNGPQFGTPLYYRPHLERFPDRSAAVLAAIARAGPGGVVFHCAGGRDRAGQTAMLLLRVAGVEVEEILADYALSDERLAARYAARGEPDQAPLLAGWLSEQGLTAGGIIARLLAEVDVEALLLDGGLTREDVAALRRRMLSPS